MVESSTHTYEYELNISTTLTKTTQKRAILKDERKIKKNTKTVYHFCHSSIIILIVKLNSLHERVLAAAAAACIQVVGAWVIATTINAKIQARQATDELAQEIMAKYFAEYVEGLADGQKARLDKLGLPAEETQFFHTIDKLTHSALLFGSDEVTFPLYDYLEQRKYDYINPNDDHERRIKLILKVREAILGETGLTSEDYLNVTLESSTIDHIGKYVGHEFTKEILEEFK